MDTGAIKIVEWIAHEVPAVPRSQVGTAPLELSETTAPHSPRVAEFFRLRISHALGGHKSDIVEDKQATSPVPTETKSYLRGATSLLAVSQVLARHLRASQTAVMSSGLLVVARITEGADNGIAILKLEPQDGAQAVRRTVNGKFTREVQILEDLVLTKGTRVFKVAAFMASDIAANGTLCGRAADPQNMTGTTDLASFWLVTYLGCTLAESPEVTTRKLLHAGEDFLNTRVEDPKLRAKYQMALMSELGNNKPTLSVAQFATDNLEVADRAEFVAAMVGAGVPRQPFSKDVELVRKHLAKLQFVFEDGTHVITSTGSVEGGIVTVEGQDDQRTRLQIIERLKRSGSR